MCYHQILMEILAELYRHNPPGHGCLRDNILLGYCARQSTEAIIQIIRNWTLEATIEQHAFYAMYLAPLVWKLEQLVEV